MSSNMREEMIDKFFADLDITKKYILTAMDELVEKEEIGVRSMLFATLIVALHSNSAMADDLFGGKEGYEEMIRMAKSFVELADQADDMDAVTEMFTGTMH
jgi:hypothetical protein